MTKASDLTGQPFGRLKVIERVGSKDGSALWRCSCACSGTTEATTSRLRSGHVQSCGCLGRESGGVRKHARTYSPEWVVWMNMIQRCTNPKNKSYSDYGGRGIAVCSAWREFSQFYKDMGDRPAGMTLERKDTDGNYEPGNCLWATHQAQSNNRRSNRHLTYKGKTQTIAQWSRECGVKAVTIRWRLDHGWKIEDVLSV